MRFDIVQRQDIGIDVGDLPVAVRHPVPQDAFCPNPVVFGRFAHDDQQVVGHGIAVGRAAGQLSEKQDVFRVEIAVRQVADHLRRFVGVVEQFVGSPGLRLWLWLRCRGGLCGRLCGGLCRFHGGSDDLFDVRLLRGLRGLGDYGLHRLFLRGVLIRFHFV